MKRSCLLFIAGLLAMTVFCQSRPAGTKRTIHGMKLPPVSAYLDENDDTISAKEFDQVIGEGYYEMQIKQKANGMVDLRLTPKPFLGLLNSTLPDFEFKDLEGKTWNNQKIMGHVAVIHFWSTTSKACIQEMGYLNAFRRVKPEIIWLALSSEPPEKIKSFLKTHIFDLTVIPVERDLRQVLFVEVLPTDFIIDQDGTIVEIIVGNDTDRLQSFIDRYLSLD